MAATTAAKNYVPGLGTVHFIQGNEMDTNQFSADATVARLAGTGAPTNGSSGTGAALAVPGSFYFDTTASVGNVYINQGTKASPVWNLASVIGGSAVSVSYALDTGAANAYVITPSPAISAYTTGVAFLVKIGAGNTNTGSSTIAVSGLAAKNIFYNGAAVTAGALVAGSIVLLAYDGTQFELLSELQDAIDPNYYLDTGAANALVATLTPAPAAYTTGMTVLLKVGAGNTNTGTCTVNLNALGAKNIFYNGAALVAGAMVAGQIYRLVYDGTNFELLSPTSQWIAPTYFLDTGAANALVITPTPAIAAYVTGMAFDVKVGAGNSSTGATTIAVSGLAAKNILFNGTALTNNGMIAGQVYQIIYDGTQFNLQNFSSGYTLPATSDTLAGLATVQTFTAGQTVNAVAGFNLGSQASGTGNGLNRFSLIMTTANVTGMNGTPFNLLPGIANKTIVIVGPVEMRYTKVTSDFTSGGAIVIQYHTGTVAATGTLAAAQLLGGSTDNVIVPIAAVSIGQNNGLEITNATGAFATGGTSTLQVNFLYYVI